MLFAAPLAAAPALGADGFRCVSYPGAKASVPETLFGPIEQGFRRKYENLTPVSEQELRAFERDLYSYDQTDLKATIESVDDSQEAWRREGVSYHAGYGGERMRAYIYLPKGFQGPFQALVFFPGSFAQSNQRKTFEGLALLR